jgi:hypothetical protein
MSVGLGLTSSHILGGRLAWNCDGFEQSGVIVWSLVAQLRGACDGAGRFQPYTVIILGLSVLSPAISLSP